MLQVKSAIKNGAVVPEHEAALPVSLRAVQHSFSVYEAMSVIDGKPRHLGEHLERLRCSASLIGLSSPFQDDEIARAIDDLIEADALRDATLRILLLGGDVPMFFITYTPLLSYPDSFYADGIKCILYSGERFLPQAKTSNLLMQYLAQEEAKKEGAFEALLVDRNGLITEGTRSNFYGMKGKRIYTAPDSLVLSGITRTAVIRAALSLGFEMVMEPVSADELDSFDSFFISSTSMGAMPVCDIGGTGAGKALWSAVADIRALVRSWDR